MTRKNPLFKEQIPTELTSLPTEVYNTLVVMVRSKPLHEYGRDVGGYHLRVFTSNFGIDHKYYSYILIYSHIIGEYVFTGKISPSLLKKKRSPNKRTGTVKFDGTIYPFRTRRKEESLIKKVPKGSGYTVEIGGFVKIVFPSE